MKFIDMEIYQTLSFICPSYMGRVRERQDLPCISYMCTDNSTARTLDGEECFTHLVYKIDLFCDHEDDYMEIAEKVDTAISSLGFKREQLTYLLEDTTHLVFYYSGYVDKNNYVYQNI